MKHNTRRRIKSEIENIMLTPGILTTKQHKLTIQITQSLDHWSCFHFIIENALVIISVSQNE